MRLSSFLYFLVAMVALAFTPQAVLAKPPITCPSLEKAAQNAKFKIRHFGGDSWEVETGNGRFYVEVSYEVCLYRMITNLSAVIPSLDKASEDWGRSKKIGVLFEENGKVFMKHTVILPNGLSDTLSWNLKIFDDLSQRAYRDAFALLVSEPKKEI